MKAYFLLILLIFSAGLGASSSSSDNNNNNNATAKHFRTALNIIHSHIAALRRVRTGNPAHNQAALITDYETLSAIIHSMPYYLPKAHPLERLHDYRPIVTHYKNETPLGSSQKFAFHQINTGINILPQSTQTQPLIVSLRQAMYVLKRVFYNLEVDANHRAEVTQHKRNAQEYINFLHAYDALNSVETTFSLNGTPTTSSFSSTTKVGNFFKPITKKEAEKQDEKLFAEAEKTKANTQKIAKKVAQALKKRQRESCNQTTLEAFFEPRKDDDDENSNKKHKTSVSTTNINNSTIIFIK